MSRVHLNIVVYRYTVYITVDTFSIQILYTKSKNHVCFKQVEARVIVMSKLKGKNEVEGNNKGIR